MGASIGGKRSGRRYRLIRADTGAVLADRLREASGMGERALGLMFRRALPAGQGLWLKPCNGVHTWFVRFPLDVIVLDEARRVVRAAPGLKPWRILPPIPGGHSTVELPGGSLTADLPRGTRMIFETLDDDDAREASGRR